MPPHPRPHAVRLLVCLLATVGLVAACTSSAEEPTATPSGSESRTASPSSPGTPAPTRSETGAVPDVGSQKPPAALRRYYQQRLTWKDCGDGSQCTRLTVPLDYAKPQGRTISLAVLRRPAPGEARASLVINPGGPGISGVSYAKQAGSQFGKRLLRRFDVVGFDPRGVGDSFPIDCLSDAQLDDLIAVDPDPDSPAEVRQFERGFRAFGRGCVRRSPGLVGHISTVEAAKDMDVLRSALGDEKLTYFGASYGTFLGATYAQLFGRNVKRMVLDGALDPSLSTVELSLEQAKGFDRALTAYVRNCVTQGGCFLGDTVAEGITRIRGLVNSIDRQPLPAGERVLKVGAAVIGIFFPLYVKSYWTYLDAGLRNALNGDGTVLLQLADAYASRGPQGYVNNSMEALSAINCLDHDDAVPFSRVPSLVPRFRKVSAFFGASFAWLTPACENWPVHTGRGPEEIHAPLAPPILVIGTTRDPATPIEWAQALSSQLRRGVLVRRDGDGHTGYHVGNQCVDDAVEDYLVEGRVPSRTLRC